MKKILIGLIALVALSAQSANNFPVIRASESDRRSQEYVQVRKFNDGPFTCYVAEACANGGKSVSISCVR